TAAIYTLSLHDALPIFRNQRGAGPADQQARQQVPSPRPVHAGHDRGLPRPSRPGLPRSAAGPRQEEDAGHYRGHAQAPDRRLGPDPQPRPVRRIQALRHPRGLTGNRVSTEVCISRGRDFLSPAGKEEGRPPGRPLRIPLPPGHSTVAGSSFSGSGKASTTSSSSLTSTLTRPPPTSLPNSSSSASGRLTLSWITRVIGRAPIGGSNPCAASQSRAAGVAVRVTFFSCSCASSSIRNLSTTRRM